MKKIVLVSDVWHPQINGVLTTLEKTVALLRGRDFEVVVIHPALFRTIPLPFYPEIKIPLLTKNTIRTVLTKEKPDYIHIITEGVLGLSSRSVCKSMHLPYTTSYHTHFPLYIEVRTHIHILKTLTYKYLQWFHNNAEATMVCTESLKKELEKHGFTHVVVWPLGVDVSLFVDTKKEVRSETLQKPVFCYFGRVAKEKNVEEFLTTPLSGTKLVIGDGPARKKLEHLYGKSAQFLGYKKGRDIVTALAPCDVMVFPSRTDTFGLTIVEALACNIPVAAHHVMGPQDIITQGVDGYLDEDLAHASTQCLTLSRDMCRKKALTFTWEASVSAFTAHLRQVPKKECL